MMCPRGCGPMHLGRYYPGQCKVFHCERCKRRLAGKRRTQAREGFNGSLVINSRIPVTHQERGV